LSILNSLVELAKQGNGVGAGHYRLCAMLKIKGYHPFFGWNKKKSHPLQKKYSKTVESIFLHAEIDVIKNAIREVDTLENAVMYLARVKRDQDKSWTWGLSHPCKGCLSAINAFNIPHLIYTTDKIDVYEELRSGK
jgi:tRNA(Arg) A34 adenosine deaminase TadA